MGGSKSPPSKGPARAVASARVDTTNVGLEAGSEHPRDEAWIFHRRPEHERPARSETTHQRVESLAGIEPKISHGGERNRAVVDVEQDRIEALWIFARACGDPWDRIADDQSNARIVERSLREVSQRAAMPLGDGVHELDAIDVGGSREEIECGAERVPESEPTHEHLGVRAISQTIASGARHRAFGAMNSARHESESVDPDEEFFLFAQEGDRPAIGRLRRIDHFVLAHDGHSITP